MKTRLKHLSKSTISILLALMMVISTAAVGIVTTTAAFIDHDDSVGWNTADDGFYYTTDGTNWTTATVDSNGVATLTVSSNVTCKYVFKIKWDGDAYRWYKKSSSNVIPNPVAQTSVSVSDSWARWDFSTCDDKPDDRGTDNFSVNLVKGTYKIKMLNTEGTYGAESNVNLKYQFYKVVDDGVYAYGDFNGKKDWSSADISRPMTEYPASSGKYYLEITSGTTDDPSLAKFRFTKWASDSITKYQADANEKSLDECTTYEAADVGQNGDNQCWNYTFSVGDKVWFEPSSKKAWVETTIINYTVNFGVQTDSSGHGTVTALVGTDAIDSGNTVASGTTVKFTAIPNRGYKFVGWYNAQTGDTQVTTNPTYNPRSISVTANENCYAKFEEETFDGYYLAGRFAVASPTADNNMNTGNTTNYNTYKSDGITGSVSGKNSEEPAYFNYWTLLPNDDNRTVPLNLKFVEVSNNLYALHTGRTIAQLSETHTNQSGGNSDHNPFYFAVHDKFNVLGATGNKGQNFQNNTESNKLTLTPLSMGPLFLPNELVFNNKDSESDGLVVIYLDVSNYNRTAGTGSAKIYYGLEFESNPVAGRVALSASPEKVKKDSAVTLTATAQNLSTGVSEAHLRYTFYRSIDNQKFTRIGTENQTANTLEYTETATGDVYYKVTVTTTDTYSKVLPTVWTACAGATSTTNQSSGFTAKSGTANATVYSPGIYVTQEHISNTDTVTWTNDLTSSYATSATPYKRETGADYNNSDPYKLAISSTGTWDDEIQPLNIADDLCQFCKITTDVVTVGEVVSTIYNVTPNTNCKNPTIYIDFREGQWKIWAVAAFDGPTVDKTIDSTETVTYYFAERSDNTSQSNPAGGGNGMRIHYWNNSAPDSSYNSKKMNGTTDVTTPVIPYGKGDNVIHVNTSKLYNNNSTTDAQFYVYSVELPIWATSFQFLTSNSTESFDAYPTYTMDEKSKTHSLTLNPNRIYLLFKDGDNWKVQGVILDTTMWDAASTRDGNEVKKKKIDANIIDYKGVEKINDPEQPNTALSGMYQTRNTPNALYFGYFTTTPSYYGFTDTNTNWAKNLAQRGDDGTNKRAYYASVWDLVGPTLSTTAFNLNGDGRTFGRLLDTQGVNTTTGLATAQEMPLFDYEDLAATTDATDLVAQGAKFPFYESTLNGITTYSYDSTTDRNRVYTAENGFQIQGDKGSESGYRNEFAYGKDSDGKGYVGFFPFGGNEDKYSNTAFGVEFDLNFYMTNTGYLTDLNGNAQDIAFNFSGDDDVWVYIDGVKVLDLGGDHKVSAATINLTDKMVYYKSSATSIDSTEISNEGTTGNWAYDDASYVKTVNLGDLMAAYGKDFDSTKASVRHTFQMFYLERGSFQSNCVISFNLPQASGLNIKNEIKATNVNKALQTLALRSSNPDYFTYYVQSKLASGNAAPVPGALAPSSSFSSVLSTPQYPYNQLTTRVYKVDGYPDISYILSDTSGANDQTSEALEYSTAGWTTVKNTVFSLTDDWLEAASGKDLLTGRTDADGIFHLLGGQKANFDNKIPINAYVRVVQTQALGEVDTSNTPVTYKAVTNNDVGNYFTTTYKVYDEKAKKYIIGDTAGNTVDNKLTRDNNGQFTNVYKADDSRLNQNSDDNGFYFSNYSGDSEDVNAAMTVEFDNEIAVGKIRISKQIADGSTPNTTFRYTVKFSRMFGNDSDNIFTEYEGLEYYLFYSNGQPVSTTPRKYTSQNGIALKAGQYAEIRGIPVETRFEIEERSTPGYSFQSYSKNAKKSDNTTDIVTGTQNQKYEQSSSTSAKTNSSAFLWKENPETDDEFVYYVNMIPPISESYIQNYSVVADNESISNVDYVNEKETFIVTFKYYDRDTTNGQPASISSTVSEYSKSWDTIEDYIIYKNDSRADNFNTLPKFNQILDDGFVCIDFESLIKASTAEFVEETGTGISNLIDDYRMWTTQAKALAGIQTITDLRTGNKYSGDNCKYHTTRNGNLNTSGDLWVNYYTMNSVTDPETHSNEAYYAGDVNNYDSVRRIEIWLFNQPKEYKVNIYGVETDSDLDTAKDITVASGNGSLPSGITFTGARVAKVSKHTDNFYYNQRLGYTMGSEYLDEIPYLNAYGVTSNKSVIPSDYAPKTVGEYKFAYWAFDAEGKEVASTEWRYGNRVTGAFDLYAVYVPTSNDDLERGNAENQKFGLTIKQDADDTFVVNKVVNGANVATPKIRINVLFNPYNLDDYDSNIQNSALLNIYTTSLIRELKAKELSDDEIKAKVILLQEKYKNQLLSMLQTLEFRKLTIGTSDPDYGLATEIHLTSKGYVYATGGSGTSVVPLTNKNRMQLTTEFTKSSLYADGVTTGILQIGAMKYNGQWVLSDNCVYRTFSKE